MGTGSFTEIKRPECDLDHPSTSSAEVKESVELQNILPSLFLRGKIWGDFHQQQTCSEVGVAQYLRLHG